MKHTYTFLRRSVSERERRLIWDEGAPDKKTETDSGEQIKETMRGLVEKARKTLSPDDIKDMNAKLTEIHQSIKNFKNEDTKKQVTKDLEDALSKQGKRLEISQDKMEIKEAEPVKEQTEQKIKDIEKQLDENTKALALPMNDPIRVAILTSFRATLQQQLQTLRDKAGAKSPDGKDKKPADEKPAPPKDENADKKKAESKGADDKDNKKGESKGSENKDGAKRGEGKGGDGKADADSAKEEPKKTSGSRGADSGPKKEQKPGESKDKPPQKTEDNKKNPEDGKKKPADDTNKPAETTNKPQEIPLLSEKDVARLKDDATKIAVQVEKDGNISAMEEWVAKINKTVQVPAEQMKTIVGSANVALQYVQFKSFELNPNDRGGVTLTEKPTNFGHMLICLIRMLFRGFNDLKLKDKKEQGNDVHPMLKAGRETAKITQDKLTKADGELKKVKADLQDPKLPEGKKQDLQKQQTKLEGDVKELQKQMQLEAAKLNILENINAMDKSALDTIDRITLDGSKMNIVFKLPANMDANQMNTLKTNIQRMTQLLTASNKDIGVSANIIEEKGVRKVDLQLTTTKAPGNKPADKPNAPPKGPQNPGGGAGPDKKPVDQGKDKQDKPVGPPKNDPPPKP